MGAVGIPDVSCPYPPCPTPWPAAAWPTGFGATGRSPDRQRLNQLLESLGRGWRLHWRDGCIHLQGGNPEVASPPTTHGSPNPLAQR